MAMNPSDRKDRWALAVAHYWRRAGLLFSLVTAIVFFLNFFGPEWVGYREGGKKVFGFVASDNNHWLGLLFYLIAILIPAAFIYFVASVTREVARKELSLGVKRVVRQLARITEEHALTAVRAARVGLTKQHQRQWNELLSAALRGLADPEVFVRHGEKHDHDFPVLFSNFELYARGVKNVLDAVQGVESLPGQRTIIWTLLKRSVIEWYLPFPAEVPGSSVAYLTFDWWEDYKKTVGNLRDTQKALQMRRLVAHRSGTEYDPRNWKIGDATSRLHEILLDSALEYHPFVKSAIDNRATLPRDAVLRLITKSTTGTDLVHHFETTYHQVREPASDDRGVFLKYIQSRTDVSDLLAYDDIFVVCLPNGSNFGLAFVNDETLDISGTRIIPGQNIPNLVSKLSQAWKNGQVGFCTLP